MVLAHVMVLALFLWCLPVLRTKDEVKRPEGHPTGSQGPEGHIIMLTDLYITIHLDIS